ncbi:MAG TPA: YibE/F family protein [Acidimicrobiales bacterium]|nr:YibE/F family protein [Acidimicrobiales bacterium]
MIAASRSRARWLTVVVVLAGAAAVLGTIAFWPRGDAPELGPQSASFVDATVRSLDEDSCDTGEGDEVPCRVVTARLTSGGDEGDVVRFQVLATQTDVPDLAAGDEVVLHVSEGTPAEFRYAFVDVRRVEPLWWLVGGFVVLVLVFGRGKGARALVGLAVAAAVLIAFLVPALVHDSPAVPVTLAATALMAFAALYLSHGFNSGTTVALAGTLLGLALIAGLALGVAAALDLSGAGAGRTSALDLAADALDLRGLLVAGIVVGALGALDDVTMSQVSIVAALRRANPGLPPRLVYREATKAGRDHMASTVNTLILAYAGVSLPLLLLFTQGGPSLGRLVVGDLIVVEIVRMVVGSIGLVAAVPITTALAALVLGTGEDVLARRASRGRIGVDPVEDGGASPKPRHALSRKRRRDREALPDEALTPVEK